MNAPDTVKKLTAKDFATDQEVRWCPGCGDYAILKTVQKLMPELGVSRANTVFISGIGCGQKPQIRDANIAEEVANLTKYQILTQTGLASLAQANAAAQGVLALF